MGKVSFWFFRPKLDTNFESLSEELQYRELTRIGSMLEVKANAPSIFSILKNFLNEFSIARKEGCSSIDSIKLCDLYSDFMRDGWSWRPFLKTRSKHRTKKLAKQLYKVVADMYLGELWHTYTLSNLDRIYKYYDWQDGKPVCFGLFMAKKND